MIVIVAAAVIWLALALTRKRTPMLLGAAILAGAWLWQGDFEARVVHASGVPLGSGAPEARTTRTCASLATGMTAAEVNARMGKPDEERSDEETRGPGAKILTYRDSRCAVHLLDGSVEFIE